MHVNFAALSARAAFARPSASPLYHHATCARLTLRLSRSHALLRRSLSFSPVVSSSSSSLPPPPPSPPPMSTADAQAKRLFDGVIGRQRAQLAKAITLVESCRADDRRVAERLIAMVLQHRLADRATMQRRKGGYGSVSMTSSSPSGAGSPAGKQQAFFPSTFRIGISGPPGAGKSTFIEAFGLHIINQLHQRVAVLAVDPSSARSGGSILGDQTRMSQLSAHANAYVRPSPTGGTLGGVTRSTTEAIALCEAAGYNFILVETVGVGQSETAVEDMTDLFLLLVPPGAGDELQGIKKGIVELADLVVVNKADGELRKPAMKTHSDYASALRLFRAKSPLWTPQALICSARNAEGIDTVLDACIEFRDVMMKSGEFDERRGKQQTTWMWKMVTEELQRTFLEHPTVRTLLTALEPQVERGLVSASAAAEQLLHSFVGNTAPSSALSPSPPRHTGACL